jgi:hypothetical protein
MIASTTQQPQYSVTDILAVVVAQSYIAARRSVFYSRHSLAVRMTTLCGESSTDTSFCCALVRSCETALLDVSWTVVSAADVAKAALPAEVRAVVVRGLNGLCEVRLGVLIIEGHAERELARLRVGREGRAVSPVLLSRHALWSEQQQRWSWAGPLPEYEPRRPCREQEIWLEPYTTDIANEVGYSSLEVVAEELAQLGQANAAAVSI